VNTSHSKTVLVWLAAVLGAAASPAAAQWRQWGGKNKDFVVAEGGLATAWPESGPKRIWDQAIGPGEASLLVESRTALTLYRDGQEEVVIAFNAQTGQRKWEYRYSSPIPEGFGPPEQLGPKATAAISGVRMFTLGSLGHLHCLNIDTGEVLWSYDPVKEFKLKPPKTGYTASAIVHMDRVLFTLGSAGGTPAAGLVVFHQRTGSFLWRKHELEPIEATGAILKIPPRDLLLLPSSKEFLAIEPLNGPRQWELPIERAASPIWDAHREILFVPSPKGCEAFAYAASGEPKPKWAATDGPVRQVISTGSLLLTAGAGESASICGYAAETGEKRWCEGGFHAPQLIYTGDRVIILDQAGTLAIATMEGDKLSIRSRVKLEKTGPWGSPSLENGILFVRDSARAFALDLR
jgi:hypothetical protein